MNRIRKKLNLDAIHRSGITGRGVNIAILDTGIYRHRDLSGNIVTGVSLREPGLYLLKYLITKEAVILPQ